VACQGPADDNLEIETVLVGITSKGRLNAYRKVGRKSALYGLKIAKEIGILGT